MRVVVGICDGVVVLLLVRVTDCDRVDDGDCDTLGLVVGVSVGAWLGEHADADGTRDTPR